MLKAFLLEQKKFIIAGGTFLAGILFFCFYQEWMIFHISFGTQPPITNQSGLVTKKHTPLFFWKDHTWQQEDVEVLWSESTAKNLEHLVSRWLSVADEEEVLSKKVTLQNAVLSDSKNIAYLSFDQYLFLKNNSVHEKYKLIEGLLQTIAESGLSISAIHFLVHHKPLKDDHLEFSHPWSIQGFVKSKK